jgi:hypothetical protein
MYVSDGQFGGKIVLLSAQVFSNLQCVFPRTLIFHDTLRHFVWDCIKPSPASYGICMFYLQKSIGTREKSAGFCIVVVTLRGKSSSPSSIELIGKKYNTFEDSLDARGVLTHFCKCAIVCT